MKKNKENNPVEVFAGTAMQAHMLKSLLENAEIEAVLRDEYTGTLNPWYSAPGGAGAVKIFVASRDYEKASIVVRDYEDKINK